MLILAPALTSVPAELCEDAALAGSGQFGQLWRVVIPLRRRVIVSALVHDPPLLIIDEPMVGLDALAQKQVRVLFRRLVEEKRTVFLTTHTLSVAEAVCDRIAILHRGRIIASGTTAELMAAGQPGSALEDIFLELTYAEP